MKHIFLVFLVPLFVDCDLKSLPQIEGPFILMESNPRGPFDPNKPVNTLVFYTDSFKINLEFFGVAYKLDLSEFSNIADKIEKYEYAEKVDTADIGYYNITIFRNGKKCRYALSNAHATLKLFESIPLMIKEPKLNEKIRRGFKSVEARLQ